MTDDLLEAALEYAANGDRVFPCDPETKRPLTTHGFHDASDDAADISAWWGRRPDALIAIVVPEGSIIIDTDPRNGGDDTEKALRREHGRGAFPTTLTAKTRGGGTHRWYFLEEQERLRGKLGTGIDVKRAGKGYVIVPPTPGYEWANERDAVDCPEWIVELLRRPEPKDREHRDTPAIPPWMDGTTYGERALQLELEKLAGAQPGERNDALNASAFSLYTLVAGGELREQPVEEALWSAAAELGLEEEETRLTIESARDAGMAEPRTAPVSDDEPEGVELPSASTSALLGGPEEHEEHFWTGWDGPLIEESYIVKPIIPREAYVLVYGPSEASKSMVMVGLGAEASRRGFDVSVYSLENPRNTDIQRLQRLEPDPAHFRLSNALVNLADPRQAMALGRREEGRDLVIIDTYSHAFAQRYDSGDGNAKAIEFARVVRWLMRATGATFVVIDHTGFDRLEEPRDASAKRQQVDVAIGMERTRQWAPGQPAHFRMVNYKSARFANPFRIEGTIVGAQGEGLEVRLPGLEWETP